MNTSLGYYTKDNYDTRHQASAKFIGRVDSQSVGCFSHSSVKRAA